MEMVLKLNKVIWLYVPWKQILEGIILGMLSVTLYAGTMNQNIEYSECKSYKIAESPVVKQLDIVSYRNISQEILEDMIIDTEKVSDKPFVRSSTEPATLTLDLPEKSAKDIGKETIAENTVFPVVSELNVIFHGNGGIPENYEIRCRTEAFALGSYGVPERLGKIFDGWYTDKECTVPFSGVSSGCATLELYAGWKDIPGFLSNDEGYIIGYTDASLVVVDNLVVLPNYKSCTGLKCGALNDLSGEIFEIYIPANIRYIEAGALEALPNLMYIEVAQENPVYYSENGILYAKSGETIATPCGW